MEKINYQFLTREQAGAIIVTVIVTVLLLALIHSIRSRYKKQLLDYGATMATGAYIAFGAARPVVLLAAVFIILSVLGVNVTSVLAGLGIAGVIIGLALQDTLKDVIMGLHIVMDHYYSVGDVVEYHGIEGTIVGFTLSTTKIGDNADHSIYSISNREISSIHRLAGRLEIDLPLSYDAASGAVTACLEEICRRIETLDGVSKCENKGLEAFQDSSILYRLRIFCPAQQRSEIRRASLQIARDALEASGIGLAVSQLEVRVKS